MKRKNMITKANELSKKCAILRTRWHNLQTRVARYHSIFSSFYSPSHLHIHIYAGVRARAANAFNASIKRRVTPTNNSIKLRAGAGWLARSVGWLVGWLVGGLRANAITFIRRLPKRGWIGRARGGKGNVVTRFASSCGSATAAET